MQITVEIPAERIMQLWWSFVESRDPVTRSWCEGVELKSSSFPVGAVPTGGVDPLGWYAKPTFFAEGVELEIVVMEAGENDDSPPIKHTVKSADVARGLGVMAKKYGRQFSQIADDQIDAPCADLFLQCVLFGEEKYA